MAKSLAHQEKTGARCIVAPSSPKPISAEFVSKGRTQIPALNRLHLFVRSRTEMFKCPVWRALPIRPEASVVFRPPLSIVLTKY